MFQIDLKKKIVIIIAFAKSFLNIYIIIARCLVNDIICVEIFNINIRIAITRYFLIITSREIICCEIINDVTIIFNKDTRIVIARCSIQIS